MNDAVIVGVFERQGDLPGVADRLFPGEAALLLQHLLDAAAVHEFHRVEVLRLVLAAAVIADDVRCRSLLRMAISRRKRRRSLSSADISGASTLTAIFLPFLRYVAR